MKKSDNNFSLAHTTWNCKYHVVFAPKYQKYANMKFKYRNREFWCRGYYVDTVGKDKKAIQQYIANQLKEDKEMEQMTIFEMNDPFKK